MPDEILDAGAESSTATQVDPSAGTQNTGTNGQPAEANVPFHLHPRWQERTQEIQTLRAQNAQLNQRLAQLEQRREQTGGPVSDEERALKEARDAFYGKVAPELKDVPQLITGLAQERFVSSGERMIETFAKQHNLDGAELSNSLAEIIKNNPALMARAQKGDVSLVSEYLRGIAPVIAAMKKQGDSAQRTTAAATGQTKLATRNLPPRSAVGGPSGQPAPETFDKTKDDPRSFWERVQNRGRQAIRAASEESA